MYRTGDLEIVWERPFTYEGDDDAQEPIYDARPGVGYSPPYPVVKLPHSCEGWVIGGIPQLRQFIADAQRVYDRMLLGKEYEDLVWTRNVQ